MVPRGPPAPTNCYYMGKSFATVLAQGGCDHRGAATPLEGGCMRTIAVVNQKGGCGKTITSINLSAFLAREGRRVLVVDMDPQGHATLGLLPGETRPSRSMYEVFMEERGNRSAVLRDV